MERKRGDAQSGFWLRTDPQRRLVRARVWGLWDLSRATQCRDALLASFTEMGTAPPWHVLSDNTRFPPQRAEVQRLISEVMKKGPKLGLARTAFLIDSAVLRMQMRRLADETQMDGVDFFTSEAEAMAWLLQA